MAVLQATTITGGLTMHGMAAGFVKLNAEGAVVMDSTAYASQSYVTTQINNLINGAPGALDTLNELAAALGNDASFATTITNSLAGKVAKAGDTMTGELVFSMSAPQIRFADTDHYDHWIHVNSNRFYVLSDRNGDGSWETPYPLELNSEANIGYVFGNTIWHSGNLTNLNQLTNGPGYITSSALSSYLPLAGGTLTGKVTFPSAVADRPQMPGGILGLNTGDGNFDIWGISTEYYPSHPTGSNAWGIQWNGDNNQVRFIGASVQRLVIDLDGGNSGLTWEGNTVWHAGNLTNLNQLTNGPGYITSYTETDTLATVTGRGATTSTPITINGGSSQPLSLTTANGSPWHLALVRTDLGLTSRVFAHNSPYNCWYFEHNISIAGNTNWHSGNDGSGSGLDADLLDGQDQSYYFSKTNMDAARNIVSGTNLDTDLENGGAYSSYGAGGTSWNAPFSYGGVIAYAFTSGIRAQFGFDIRHNNSNYGDLWYRTKNNLGYSTWRTMLHSGNYNSYAPTLTGGGASGTWGISITGNAATLGGYGPNQTGGAYTIVQRDANGYIQNSYFYMSGGGSERNSSGLGYIAGFNSSDYYVRSYNSTAVASFLGLGSMAYASTSSYFSSSGGTLNGYLTVSANWSTSPYTSALTIIGTYPSITFRGSNSDWEWLQHVDSVGNFHFYGGAGYTVNNWNNKLSIKTSGQLILKNHSTADSGYDNPLWIWATADSDAIVIQNTTSGGTAPKIYFRDTNGIIQTGNSELRLRTSNSNSYSAYLSGGDWYATGSMRAPIFYDSNDTSYYVDPNSSSNINSITTVGRIYSNEWIQFSNYTGLYSPNNGAHFRPNSGSYGPWLVTGTRNGWSGIEFESLSNGNVAMMIATSSNTSGWHNNSYGWQFKWDNGTAYVYKSAYGGGTAATVLDSSNYTSYAPSLTGSGASGTWGINITGNAASATYAGYARRIDGVDRTQFTVGGNSSTYYPVAIYSGAGATSQQYCEFVIERGGYDDPGYSGIGFSTFNARFTYKPSGWGYGAVNWSLEMLGQTTTMLADYTDYYQASQFIVWLRGATTYWLWNVVGGASIAFANGSGGNYAATYQTFSPTTSVAARATTTRNFYGTLRADDTITAGGSLIAGYDMYLGASSSGQVRLSTYNNRNFQIIGTEGTDVGILATRNGASSFGFQVYGEGTNYGFLNSAWGSWDMRKVNGGNLYLNNQSTYYLSHDVLYTYRVYGTADMRSPIYYDLDDTSYYCDPNSTSRLHTVGSFYLQNNYGIATDHTYGIYFDSGRDSGYAIYRESGGWSYPFPDLRIAFHTGIKLGANSGYQGIRFYTDYDMSSQVMSVNNGSDPLGGGNVYVNNSLQAGSSLRAPIFYDSDNTAYYADFANSGTSIKTAGNVLIGQTYDPGNKLQVNGNIYAVGDVTAYSDIRVKTNIRSIERVVERIMNIRGVIYDRTDIESNDNIGFIAQELEEQFPELIHTNNDGTKGVKYQNMTAILVEVVKKQQKQIEELKAKLDGLTK